jgi:hypothetical protein
MLPDPEADIYYVGFVLGAIMSFDAREQSQMAKMSDTLEKDTATWLTREQVIPCKSQTLLPIIPTWIDQRGITGALDVE